MTRFAYAVTDVELDGFSPGANSMRSFASVAIDATGSELGRFEAVLEPLPGSVPSPDTLAWFRTSRRRYGAPRPRTHSHRQRS